MMQPAAEHLHPTASGHDHCPSNDVTLSYFIHGFNPRKVTNYVEFSEPQEVIHPRSYQ